MQKISPTTRKASFSLLSALLVLSCQNPGGPDSKAEPGLVQVTTNNMDFQLPTKIKTGWHTFQYVNNSTETHFFIFEKLPDGIRLENYEKELVPPFKAAFEDFDKGETEAGMNELKKIPEWFTRVQLGGGVGLTSPKSTTESTLFLSPGVYAMECYVRMPNGTPHAFVGMLKELLVSDSAIHRKAPDPDFEITVSSTEGISFRDSIPSGKYTFAVRFKDQKQYETMLGHDVNLVKMDALNNLDTLDHWINAANIKAFRTPAPEGMKFLGGVEDLPAGKTGYFNAMLEAGDYVLISEVPEAVNRKMYKIFTVTDQNMQ